ncbi:hypothetical protein BJX66DRAFT_233027 [Aspergillus keveii]|uniref:Azaphilone pigments biosynthesis cluster protein L N-terminal domain-containing protein n=1 Tax=Aspergillus keveii TaxID=714993 RepID=A0ABR4G1V9_9EURO
MMVEVLEDLKKHVSHRKMSTLSHDASVSFVLQICLEKCKELQALLSGLVDHSSSGRFSIRSRTRVALKKNDIEDLRRDISSGRESLAVALGSLNLVTSTNSHDAIARYHDQATKTTDAIKQRVQEIQTTLSVMGSRLDQETERILNNQSAALKEHLRLCEESIKLVREQARYRSEFGNITSGDAARTFAGVATKQLQGGVDQKFGDSHLGAQSVTFMGASDTAAMLGFFERANVQTAYAVGGDGQTRDLPRFEVILPQIQSVSGHRRASAPQALPESTSTPQFIVERVPSRERDVRKERIIDRGRHH